MRSNLPGHTAGADPNLSQLCLKSPFLKIVSLLASEKSVRYTTVVLRANGRCPPKGVELAPLLSVGYPQPL